MTVWVSPRGRARHDVRIKVNRSHGNRMTITNTAIVAVRPLAAAGHRSVGPADEQAVFQWVRLNEDALGPLRALETIFGYRED